MIFLAISEQLFQMGLYTVIAIQTMTQNLSVEEMTELTAYSSPWVTYKCCENLVGSTYVFCAIRVRIQLIILRL